VIFNALHSTAISGLEMAINAALQYDPATQRDLALLENQVLLVDCSMPPLRIAVQPSKERIALYADWDAEAAVTIKGSLVALASMAVNPPEAGSFAGSGVQLSGNLDSLHRLHKILSQLDIDWQAALADMVGDVPAHLMAEAIRKSATLGKQNTQRTTSAMAEVVQEELQLTPSRHAFQQFRQEVRQLAADTDRAMAKISELRAKIDQHSDDKPSL